MSADEGDDINDEGRRDWARVALLELVDARITESEALQATLDLDRTERDRRKAQGRSTFDDSKQASLTRGYEAHSDRDFYKAPKEFRQVEGEALMRIEASLDLPIPDLPDSKMGSFGVATPPADRERTLASLGVPMAEIPKVRKPEGLPPSPAGPSQRPPEASKTAPEALAAIGDGRCALGRSGGGRCYLSRGYGPSQGLEVTPPTSLPSASEKASGVWFRL